jgi:serine/threonine protein kinase/tetratricopeptide (TPR) repeat protein
MNDTAANGAESSRNDAASRTVQDRTADLGGPAEDRLDALPVEVPGSRIGPYRIVHQIGEGGFGSVYLAEQELPVQRSVALKVVKLGMDTRRVVARFEQERQTLALMEHPNVARVLDAGTTASGRPYFVMELVKGDPIVDYCDKNRLGIDERAALVVDVCHGVQHAHTKGIIHRDLKPSNILVSVQDEKPCPKVIDFGIAKAIHSGGLERDALTEQRQLIGTPQYMSPEQAEGSSDIDTRTDVYSLGVLLYELLAGTTPFSGVDLSSTRPGELQRVIREDDPPPPSVRIARSSATIADIAARRRAEPATLGRAVRGELDWIVMKALEKDRRRRYGSPSELAADIGRYLSGDAVIAAPPSRAYLLRKFVRRNRVPVGAAAAVALAIVAGAAAVAWQASIARDERDRARVAEEEQRARAAELKVVAEFQARMLSGIDVVAAGDRLMAGLRDQFAAAIEDASGGDAASVRSNRIDAFSDELRLVNSTDTASEMIRSTVLRPAVAAIDAEFRGQPLVDATLRLALADVFRTLGSPDEALPLARRSVEIRRRELGVHDRATLEAMDRVAIITESLGRLSDADPVYREAYEGWLAHFGPDDPGTLSAMANLGNVLRAQGKMAEAEPLLRDALAGRRRVLGDAARDTLVSMNMMGFLYAIQGDFARAEPLWREAYETGRRVFGEDDADVIVWTYNLAGLLGGIGKLSEAESLYRIVLEKYRRLYGDAHPTTVAVLGGLCTNLIQQSKLADAEPIAREAMERAKASSGPEHPITVSAMVQLGSLLTQSERAEEALPLLREALAIRRRTVGDDRQETVGARDALARALVLSGRGDEAAAVYAEAIEIARRVLGPEHPLTLIVMVNAGNAYLLEKRPAEAAPLIVEALAARRRTSGDDHRETIVALSNLGLLREQEGRLDEAESAHREAMERLVRTLGAEHTLALNAQMSLASVLRRKGSAGEAESILRALRPSFERRSAPDSLRVAGLRFLLGQAIADLGRFEEARAELEPAVARILAAPSTHAARASECIDAMVSLFERWDAAEPGKGHDAEAARWRAKADGRDPDR